MSDDKPTKKDILEDVLEVLYDIRQELFLIRQRTPELRTDVNGIDLTPKVSVITFGDPE